MFCQFCGNHLPENSVFCPKCGKQLQNKKYEYETINNWEYLWAIFFGIFGGLFLYFYYRHKNPKAARDGLLIGMGISVLGIIISSIIWS